LGKGLFECSSAGDFIYVVTCDNPHVLNVWRWTGHRVRQYEKTPVGEDWYNVVWWCKNRIGYTVKMDEVTRQQTFVVKDTERESILDTWKLPPNWWVENMGQSLQGNYTVLMLDEEHSHPPEGFDWKYDRFQLGLLGPDQKEILWLGVFRDTVAAMNIRTIVPTDDGAYVALAGWKNGLAMVDCKERKLLWVVKPPNESSSSYAAFSPDRKVVYVGGTEGCVYGLDVRTGRILSRWFASPTGKELYGHRISSISASPNGEFVAAGTGPQGLVWVFETKNGKIVSEFDHGGSTILLTHFSPDSSALATMAAGYIKIWKIPAPTTAPSGG
jgi:WD40 repeat protein